MGIATTYYDPCIDAAGLEKLFRPNTTVLYTESPGSHTFEVQDIPALAAVAHAHGCKVLMDNTWGIHFFQPFKHGVDVSIQALTKYVGGHSDVLLGGITTNSPADWERVRIDLAAARPIRQPRRLLAGAARRADHGGAAGAADAVGPRGRALAGGTSGGEAGAASRPARRARTRLVEARLHRRVQPVRRRVPADLQHGSRRIA